MSALDKSSVNLSMEKPAASLFPSPFIKVSRKSLHGLVRAISFAFFKVSADSLPAKPPPPQFPPAHLPTSTPPSPTPRGGSSTPIPSTQLYPPSPAGLRWPARQA